MWMGFYIAFTNGKKEEIEIEERESRYLTLFVLCRYQHVVSALDVMSCCDYCTTTFGGFGCDGGESQVVKSHTKIQTKPPPTLFLF